MSDSTPIPSAAIDHENPWPGLESYTESSRPLFFGREQETEELVRLIRRNTLTVLFGQSGLGKSSLLQAGAFPGLREADFLPLYLRLDHEPAAPALADQVKTALVAAFKSVGADAPAPRPDETLWEYFHRKEVDIWSAKNRLLTPILAFDQFEEIFTLGRASETARARGRAFLVELADLVENRAPAALREKFDRGDLDIARYNFDKPSCQVVLSLREDFLPDLEGLKHEMRSILHSRMRVKRLNGTQALEIVQKPAPHLLADGVAERVVEFVAGARGGSTERLAELEVEPALLSVICRELNDRRRTLGQATITVDLVSGNRREILTDFYERSVADLPEPMRLFVEDRMLTKSGFRDNLALETALETPGVTRPLVDTLVSRRLLRIEDRLGVQRVELTHDVLAEVIRASRDARQQRATLAEAAQRARRQRWTIGGLAAAVVALCIGAVFGLRAQRRAEQAQREEAARSSRTDLAYGSQLLEQGKTAEGIAYLSRAARSDPMNSAVGPRLISALAYRAFSVPVGLTYAHDEESVVPVAFSADGTRVITASIQGSLYFWDVASGRQVAPKVKFDSDPAAGTTSGDGSRYAVGLTDGTIRIWDIKTAKLIAGPLANGKGILPRGLALNHDGSLLAAVTNESVAKIWDVATGQMKVALPHTYHWVSSVDFSRDGQRLLTTQFGNARPQPSYGWRVWSVPTGEPLTPFRSGATSQINFGRFTPDGKYAAICDNGGVQLWDWAAGEKVGQKISGIGLYSTVHFAPDSSWLITVDDREQAARIWNVPSGTLQSKFEFSGNFVLSRDGKKMLGSRGDGSVHLVDAATGKPLMEPLRGSHTGGAEFSPDEKEIWTGGRDGVVRRWRAAAAAIAPLRVSSDKPLGAFYVLAPRTVILGTGSAWEFRDLVTGETVAPTINFPSGVRNLLSSDDKKFAAVTLQDRSVELWDLRQPEAIKRTPLEKLSSPRLRFSTNGQRLSQYNFGMTDVIVWETNTGKRIEHKYSAASAAGSISATSFSDDGSLLALGDTLGDVVCYDVKSGKQLGGVVRHGTQIVTVAFSPDRSHLASSSANRVVRFSEVATGRELLVSPRLRAVANILRYADDGRSITIPTQTNNEVLSWNTRTGALRTLRLSDDKAISSFDFDPSDERIAVSDALDARVRVWSTTNGLLVAEPILPLSNLSYAKFSPDGRFALTMDLTRNTVAVWPIPALHSAEPVPAWLPRMATAVIGRTLGPKGEFEPAPAGPEDLAAVRTELAALPDRAPWVQWGRWFLADPETRSISPEGPLTPAQAAQFLREDPLSALVEQAIRLRRLDRRAEAESAEKEIVALAHTHQNAESKYAGLNLQQLITALVKEGKFTDAEPLARACLELRERNYETGMPSSWVIANSRSFLGESLLGQKRYAEAEPHLLRSYDELRNDKDASKARTMGVANLLARLYQATNQPDKAKQWSERAAAVPEGAASDTAEPLP